MRVPGNCVIRLGFSTSAPDWRSCLCFRYWENKQDFGTSQRRHQQVTRGWESSITCISARRFRVGLVFYYSIIFLYYKLIAAVQEAIFRDLWQPSHMANESRWSCSGWSWRDWLNELSFR